MFCMASGGSASMFTGDSLGSEGVSVKRGRLTLEDYVFPRAGVG